MTQIKKFAWSSAAAAVALAMAMAMLVSVASAAATVTTPGAVTVNLATNAANGTNAGTVLTTQPTLTFATAGEFAVGQTIVLNAPTGWAFTAVTSFTGAGALTTTQSIATGGGSLTITATVTNGAADAAPFVGLAVKPLIPNAATGNITVSSSSTYTGIAAGTVVGTITAGTAFPTSGTITLTPSQTEVTAAGTDATTITVVLAVTGVANVRNTNVSCTSGAGYLSSSATGIYSSTSNTATVNTGNTGTTSLYMRGAGTATTDTIVCSSSDPAAVATQQITIAAATGTTPTTLNLVSTGNNNIGGTSSTSYQSPTTSTTLTVSVTDASSAGVNGQVLLISVDKGAVVAGSGTSCTGVTTKSITMTTAIVGTTAGRVQFTVCASSTSANKGTVTVTVKDISKTSVADLTATVTAAGAPANIATTASGNTVTATVTDADGNLVADGTPVRFTIASTVGVASVSCATTTNGKASSTIALTGSTGNVLVSSDYNKTGAASTCGAAGSESISAVQALPGTGGTGGTGTGDGTLTTPEFGANSYADAVFGGGSIDQLAAAVTSAGGTSVWVSSGGVFYRYNTLATGATAFVNNAFIAAFEDGITGPKAVFVVK